MEYNLSVWFGVPINSREIRKKYGETGCITERTSFKKGKEVSIQQQHEINKRKERIQKLKDKVKKHPKRYEKMGIILGCVEISQKELIDFGLDPDRMGWQEIEKAKVHSDDIVKLSKEKGVKKSLISRISGIFSKKKEEREI